MPPSPSSEATVARHRFELRVALGLLGVLAIGTAWWITRAPRQRPTTLPDGATIFDEDSYADGSYDVHVRCTEEAWTRWVESIGMHEVDDDEPRARRWRGPDVDGCSQGTACAE